MSDARLASVRRRTVGPAPARRSRSERRNATDRTKRAVCASVRRPGNSDILRQDADPGSVSPARPVSDRPPTARRLSFGRAARSEKPRGQRLNARNHSGPDPLGRAGGIREATVGAGRQTGRGGGEPAREASGQHERSMEMGARDSQGNGRANGRDSTRDNRRDNRRDSGRDIAELALTGGPDMVVQARRLTARLLADTRWRPWSTTSSSSSASSPPTRCCTGQNPSGCGSGPTATRCGSRSATAARSPRHTRRRTAAA